MPKHGITHQEEEYLLKYGALPSAEEELLSYVLEKYPFSSAAFEKAVSRIDELRWESIDFVLYLVPTPTPRPRSNGHHFYVKGAAENKKIIKRYIEQHIIATRAEIDIEAYLPTPTSRLTNAEIYLAEKKLIYPVGSYDVDNMMKTYLDMIQGHLLVNDCIVTRGLLEKFFSVKPRLHITIRYQTGYDSRYNERRITSSKLYQQAFGKNV